MVQAEEHLTSKHKTVSSNTSTTKTTKKNNKKNAFINIPIPTSSIPSVLYS
jgi:hypothetical protein